MEDTFCPEKLIGKRIWFRCEDRSVNPVEFELLSIKKHYKATRMHVGRYDLVIYDTEFGDMPLLYEDICNLIDTGIHKGRHIDYEIKVINTVDK